MTQPAQPDRDREEPEGVLGYRMTRGRFIALLGLAAGIGWAGWRFATELQGGFRLNTVENPTPEFDPATYTLTVDGLVEVPLTLDWEGVRALPATRLVADFHCVEGWGVSDVRWEGTRLVDLAARVRPREEVRYVNFYSMGDTYSESLNLFQASTDDVLLAWGMDGGALPKDHGAPLRVIWPRMFGYKGAKWLKRIEFTDRPVVGFWVKRGWAQDAWISARGLPNSR